MFLLLQYNKGQREILTGNLQYIRQVRLQGDDTSKAVAAQIVTSQQEEIGCLKKPLLIYSFHGVYLTVVIFFSCFISKLYGFQVLSSSIINYKLQGP